MKNSKNNRVYRLIVAFVFSLLLSNLSLSLAQSNNNISGFGRNITKRIATEKMIAVKFVTYDAYDQSKDVGRLYITPQRFLEQESAFLRQTLLALTPQNKADGIVIYEINIGAEYMSGPCEEGYLATYSSPDKSVKPVTKFYSPDQYKDIQAAIARDTRFFAQKGLTQQEVTPPRIGGAMQFYLNEDQRHLVKVLEVKKLDNPPPTTPNTPSTAPQPKMNIQTTPDRGQINTIIKKYEAFPGGIIAQSVGQCSIKISKLVYLTDKHQFLINDRYYYDPQMGNDELATIMNAAFSESGNFAALSQSQMIGMPNDGMVAFTLGKADRFLGTIAYGYDTDGNAVPAHKTMAGYGNPLTRQLQDINPQNKAAVFKFIGDEFRGVEPRLFINYKTVQFGVQNNQIIPQGLDIDIHYQTFTTSDNRNFTYTSGSPEEYFPHIIKAINHFKDHYKDYEKQEFYLMRSRQVAECYAFFNWLKQNGQDSTSMQPIRVSLGESKSVDLVQNNYNNIGKSSDLYRYWQTMVERLETWDMSAVTGFHKLAYYDLLLTYALNLDDPIRIKKYREKCLNYAFKGFPENPVLKGSYDNAADYASRVRYRLPMTVSSQISFARNYEDVNETVHTYNLNKATQWLKKQTQLETNYALYDRLYGLYNSYVDTIQAKKFRITCYSLMEQELVNNDVYAQYLVGLAYLNGTYRPLNAKKGFDLILKSANQGYVNAQHRMGILYFEKKDESTLNPKFAFDNMSKAAPYHADAAYALGYFYENGIGCQIDIDEATYWYKQAAQRGSEPAEKALKRLLNT